jgi:hypothetical protein
MGYRLTLGIVINEAASHQAKIVEPVEPPFDLKRPDI